MASNLKTLKVGKNAAVELQLDDLTGHGIICGRERTGKSALARHLLKAGSECQVPFLVIAPAKNEYRSLVYNLGAGSQARIFTVGDLKSNPLFLNIFEPVRGANIGRHIDDVMTLLSRCYGLSKLLVTPLRNAVRQAYEKKGWALQSDANNRFNQLIERIPEAYPLWSDVAEQVPAAVEKLDEDQRLDVKDAMESLIESFTEGPNASVFNGLSSPSFPAFFRTSMVVELEELTGDDRTFYCGMLLLLLQEFYEMHERSSSLQQLVLIDDVERVPNLAKVLTGTINRGPLTRETQSALYVDKLRDVGVSLWLISKLENDFSQQIPTRIVCGPASERQLGKLRLEESWTDVAADGVKARELLITVEEKMYVVDAIEYGGTGSTASPDEQRQQLTEWMQINDQPIDRLVAPGCEYSGDMCDMEGHERARAIAMTADFRKAFYQFILAVCQSPTQLIYARKDLVHQVQAQMPDLKRFQMKRILWCAIAESCRDYFRHKSDDHQWNFNEEFAMRTRLLNILAEVFTSSRDVHMPYELIKGWIDDFQFMQARDQGPRTCCGPCAKKCVYKTEIAQWTTAPYFFDFNSTINRETHSASYSAAWFCAQLSEIITGEVNVDLAYCLAVHYLENQYLSPTAQMILAEKIRKTLPRLDKLALLSGQAKEEPETDEG
jgi:hypothetical protein